MATVDKMYQCEECKVYFKKEDIVEVYPASSTGKTKKIHVCKTCFTKKYQNED
ncbi:MAG: hypothetical protein ACYCSB_06965 [bacterium]|jgi:hypothetical protein